MTMTTLARLPHRCPARVDHIAALDGEDLIARRLQVLGFVAGRRVEVLRAGPVGGDPLLVRIGDTRFALRRAEADRIQVRPEAA